MKLIQCVFMISLVTMSISSPSATIADTVSAKNDQVKGPIGICPSWPTCPPPSSEETQSAKTA